MNLEPKKNKVVWKCKDCEDTITSDKNSRHKVDYCTCRKVGLDYEQNYARVIGNPALLKVLWKE